MVTFHSLTVTLTSLRVTFGRFPLDDGCWLLFLTAGIHFFRVGGAEAVVNPGLSTGGRRPPVGRVRVFSTAVALGAGLRPLGGVPRSTYPQLVRIS